MQDGNRRARHWTNGVAQATKYGKRTVAARLSGSREPCRMPPCRASVQAEGEV